MTNGVFVNVRQGVKVIDGSSPDPKTSWPYGVVCTPVHSCNRIVTRDDVAALVRPLVNRVEQSARPLLMTKFTRSKSVSFGLNLRLITSNTGKPWISLVRRLCVFREKTR